MWAVVPLKSPQRAKMRLAAVLDPAQRRHLLFELAARVIRALQATRGIEAVAVISASAEVAAFARALGAEPMLQSDESGTAAAFAEAVRRLEPLRLPRLLMLAGDLPLVSPAALESLLAADDAHRAWSAVVVPDRHRAGTNALLCTPPQVLAPCFGSDSFRRHLAAADAAGVAVRVLEREELALDLDCAEDLEALRLRGGEAAIRLFEGLQDAAGGAQAREADRRAALMQ